MTVIRLSGQGKDPGGAFKVRVSFGDEAEYDVVVTDPATEADEQNLAWYFEEHLRYPFLDTDREQLAVKQIRDYGDSLFQQVFGGAANHSYQTLRERSFDGCRLEVSGSSALHRLHWESLRDPDLDLPLSLRLPVTRRVAALASKFVLPERRPTLNVLVVVARPDGNQDVGYRTISRPLLDALRTAHLPITVDLVRPGTWQALREHLRSVTERYGSGWYHAIHFDLHGAFIDLAQLQDRHEQSRLTFAAGHPEPFHGKRGFLFFETERDGVAAAVPAQTVASLLAEHRVPVAVLNACQSAMQSSSEAGLAQRLVDAGVPVAMGMAYSVTVSAALEAMPVLYGRLADGADPVQAVHAARRELHEHRGRQAYFDQQIDLEDWLLPVVFAQRPLQVELRDMTDAEQEQFFARSARVGDEPATEYGFVGRDLDIQAIERRMLASKDSNELLVQGMAGAGKSTLLRHLAWWWQRTGLVGEVFRFSYEDRAWTSGQIVREIRGKLFSHADHARADAMSVDAQLEQIAHHLRAHRHLLIIDNAESITAAPAAIPHAISADEQQALKNLLARLRGGRSLVLLGSREAETWLTSSGPVPGAYPMPGLDPQAVSILVERILRRYGAAHYVDDDTERAALENLVTLLGGYPLPLTAVLPVLASSPPTKVLAELNEGGPGADPAGLIQRTIEYSHGKLHPELQNSLLLLAPFTAVINGGLLGLYQKHLQEDQAIKDLGPIDVAAALQQAMDVGLAAPYQRIANMAEIQPVLPYFLRSRLKGEPSLRDAANQAHYRVYYDWSIFLNNMIEGVDLGLDPAYSPSLRVTTGLDIVKAEYANLTAALSHALRTAQPVGPLIATLTQYLDQVQQHDTRRQLLDISIAAYPDPQTGDQRRELAQLHNLAGNTAYKLHRLGEAKVHYEVELELKQAAQDRRAQGTTYHQLGMVAQEERNFTEADANYRKALDIKLELGDRQGAALTYSQMGILADLQHRFAEAEANYRTALNLHLELSDQRGAAGCYHNLGKLAYEQGQFADAEANYLKALDIKLEYGDRHSAARSYHALGVAYYMQQRFAEAEANYRKALDIFLEFDDHYGAAGIHNMLGVSAIDQRRYAEAEANYRKALEIFLKFGDRYSAAGIYHNLGELAQRQQRPADAETNYREALQIYQESDLRSASKSAHGLGIVLAQRGRHHAAVKILLFSERSWHQETGQWYQQGLQLLHRERAAVGMAEFRTLITEDVPRELSDELIGAIDQAKD